MHSAILVAIFAVKVLSAPLPGVNSLHGASDRSVNTPTYRTNYHTVEDTTVQTRGTVRTQARALNDGISVDQEDEEAEFVTPEDNLEEHRNGKETWVRAIRNQGRETTINEDQNDELSNPQDSQDAQETASLLRINRRSISRNKNGRSAEAEAEALLRINRRSISRNKNGRSAEAEVSRLNSRDGNEYDVKVESGAQELETQAAQEFNKRVAEAEPVFRAGGK